MKRKVYWIHIAQLREVYNDMTQDDASIICQEHYQLVEQLPHNCSLTAAKPIVYWIEGREVKMSTHLNEIRDFEYKQLTVSSFFIDKKDENRLQKQKADVVRGDDTEGNRVQSRKRKTAIAVGHLSYKSIKS